MGCVYLICLDTKFHHCKHYIGYTTNLEKRLARHRNGTGSRLLRAVNLAGINYVVSRIWGGKDGNFERLLKKRKKASDFCPRCGKGRDLVCNSEK